MNLTPTIIIPSVCHSFPFSLWLCSKTVTIALRMHFFLYGSFRLNQINSSSSFLCKWSNYKAKYHLNLGDNSHQECLGRFLFCLLYIYIYIDVCDSCIFYVCLSINCHLMHSLPTFLSKSDFILNVYIYIYSSYTSYMLVCHTRLLIFLFLYYRLIQWLIEYIDKQTLTSWSKYM